MTSVNRMHAYDSGAIGAECVGNHVRTSSRVRVSGGIGNQQECVSLRPLKTSILTTAEQDVPTP